jgi:hypothetical protein
MSDSNSQNARKYKIYSIISLALGISVLILSILFNTNDRFLDWVGNSYFLYALFAVGGALLAGIISGKKGLDSSLSGVALAGVVLCLILFVYWFLLTGWFILSIFWSRI